MKVKEHPELSDKCPAIDGIDGAAKKEQASQREGSRYPIYEKISLVTERVERAVRSDVEEILAMGESEFNEWYISRYRVVKGLLDNYKLFSSIPNLSYGSEESKYDMTVHVAVKDHLEALKKGLEYLTVINLMRTEAIEDR